LRGWRARVISQPFARTASRMCLKFSGPWALQEALGVEEAQAFCEACLAEIEADAERIEPGWYERYMSQ